MEMEKNNKSISKVITIAMVAVILIFVIIFAKQTTTKMSIEGQYIASDENYIIKLENNNISIMEDGYYISLGSYTYSNEKLTVKTKDGQTIYGSSESIRCKKIK